MGAPYSYTYGLSLVLLLLADIWLTLSCVVANARQVDVTDAYNYYSAPVGERSIAISLSVCLSVREHISGTAGPIVTIFMQIPYGHSLVLLWRRCDTLCTSGFMDDVTFGRSGPCGDTWLAALR